MSRRTRARVLEETRVNETTWATQARALRRMQTCELTPAMMQAAAQVGRKYYAKPVGTNVDTQVDCTWGFHPGVSLFAVR